MIRIIFRIKQNIAGHFKLIHESEKDGERQVRISPVACRVTAAKEGCGIDGCVP